MKSVLILLLWFANAQTATWQVVSNQGPEPRYVTKFVNSSEGLLLFGGKNSDTDGFNDLWRWQHGQWEFVGYGATKRWDHSYVYIQDQKNLFVFGGRTFGNSKTKERIELKDSWVFENGGWQELDIPGPPARSSHAMESLGSKALMFGGRNQDSIFSDTWVFDGKWRQLFISGPEKRFGHSMSFDQTTQSLFLFGGHNGETLLNDLWKFKDGQWTEIKTNSGPSPRMAHSMQFDTQGDALLFGGWAGSVSGELWKWSGGKWTLDKSSKTPQARLSHALGYDSKSEEFVLFGGSTGFGEGFLSETWKLK